MSCGTKRDMYHPILSIKVPAARCGTNRKVSSGSKVGWGNQTMGKKLSQGCKLFNLTGLMVCSHGNITQ